MVDPDLMVAPAADGSSGEVTERRRLLDELHREAQVSVRNVQMSACSTASPGRGDSRWRSAMQFGGA